MKHSYRMRVASLCAAVMWALVAGGICMAGTQPEFPRPVLKGVHEQSPSLAGKGFALEFTLLPAQSPTGPTLGLFGAVRAGFPFTERYGGRLAGAVQIVAIDPATGRVFHGVPERSGTVPLSPLTDSELRKLGQADAIVDEITAYFNVDLVNHLSLPGGQANWNIFLWLDDHLSPAQTYTLSTPVPEGGGKTPPVEKAKSLRVSAAGQTILKSLEPGSVRFEEAGASRCLSGKYVSGVLRFGREQSGASSPGWITVLSLCGHTRTFRYESAPIPMESRKAEGVRFSFRPKDLAGCRSEDERRFFVVMSGRTISNVLVLERGPSKGRVRGK